MDAKEVEALMSILGSLGVGAIIGGGVVYLFLKSFLPSYFAEKGKNLATKEDVESITDKVESVKTDYAKVLEELRSSNQLKHSEIDREKNIKKEVYLQAIDALTKAQNVIASLSDLNISTDQLSKSLTSDSGLMSKVQIVGSERTVKSVLKVMASIGTAVAELMPERGELDIRKSSINNLTKLRENQAAEIEHYISIMKNLNLDGNNDPRLWDSIKLSIDHETKQRDSLTAQIDELVQRQIEEALVFSGKCLDRYFQSVLLVPEFVLSIREELNLPISNDAYLEVCKQNIEDGQKVFGKFLEKIK